MPLAKDLQHADYAAYALLEGLGFLGAEQRTRLRSTLPPPTADRRWRPKLYGSSVYVYLLARGSAEAGGVPYADELVRVAEEGLESMTAVASPDLIDLMLLFAARLEIAGEAPIPEETIRRVRGRVAGAQGSWEAAVALRWILEQYANRWPVGEEGATLRDVVTAHAGRWAAAAPAGDARPVILAMQLELATRRDPEFRLVSRVSEEAALAARLGRRRWLEGVAYLFAISVLAGWPMYAAVSAGWFVPLVGWAGALGWGIPAAMSALLVVLGRPRHLVALGGGITLGLLYAGTALYAGWSHRPTWLSILGGEGALLELLVTVVAAVWAGVVAARSS
jgi:hypothetical protein